MSTHLYAVAYKRNEAGEYDEVEDANPFCVNEGINPYSMFGFIANVRNYSQSPVIAETRGLPDFLFKKEEPKNPILYGFCDDHSDYIGWLFGEHSKSWLTIEEMLAYDYDQTFEERRNHGDYGSNCSDTVPIGKGQMMTLREFLPTQYFESLDRMKNLGVDVVVFGFRS